MDPWMNSDFSFCRPQFILFSFFPPHLLFSSFFLRFHIHSLTRKTISLPQQYPPSIFLNSSIHSSPCFHCLSEGEQISNGVQTTKNKHLCKAYFGLFDGHGGAKAVEFAFENLQKNIIDEIEKKEDGENEEAVKKSYLRTDSELLEQDVWGGSYSLTALIRKGNLVVSNVGDCRTVVSRGDVAEALTSDHRPSRQDERDKIESLVDLVTETDKACEDLIFSHLKQHFPQHKFIDEEITAANGVTELTDEPT